MKLNREDLVLLFLDYKVKFNCILDNLKQVSSKVKDEIKGKFTELASDLNMPSNVYNKPPDRLHNEPYSRRECLEISGPPGVKKNE